MDSTSLLITFGRAITQLKKSCETELPFQSHVQEVTRPIKAAGLAEPAVALAAARLDMTNYRQRMLLNDLVEWLGLTPAAGRRIVESVEPASDASTHGNRIENRFGLGLSQ